MEQKKAVKHSQGPLLVLAGAGSGKTRVITHRIAYLIKKYGVLPSQIMGVTFTNKACDEMKIRVEKLLRSDLDGLWIKTFHAACARILRESGNISLLSPHYNSSFTILDEVDQRKVVKQTMEELDISPDHFSPSQAAKTINRLKNDLISPTNFSSKVSGAKDNFWNEVIALVYEDYQGKIRENNALDFGDLLRLTVELFQNNLELLRRHRQRFKFILIDEYQDINYAQYIFSQALAEEHENICVVGDDDQSIFGWRGADPTNILKFEEDFPDVTIIKLCQNYRSTGKILHVASSVIKNNLGRKEKELFTNRKGGKEVQIYRARDEKEEASYVTSEIKMLKDSGRTNLSEIAILYRINTLSRSMEEALIRGGIPYEIVRGVGFYRRMEVKDILSYLRAILNPANDLSILRIFNKPKRGLGKKTENMVKKYAKKHGLSFWSGAVEMVQEGNHLKQSKRLKEFVKLLEDLRARKGQKVSEVTGAILDKTGYIDYLRGTFTEEETEERVGNIRELIGQMQEFEVENGEGIEHFLENVALVSDIDCFNDRDDRVSLMTLHSAKGLEFDHVFMVGMEENLLPHSRSITEEQVEEERRLCYVGITRAKERLWLTYVGKRSLYGGKMYNPPSRFFDEMPSVNSKVVGGEHGTPKFLSN